MTPAPCLAALVGEDRDAGANRLRVGQLQRRLLGALAEQALAAAEDDREDHQPQLVDQAVREQAPHQLGAAGDQDHAVDLALDLGDLLGEVAGEHRRVVPLPRLERGGDDVLRHRIHLVGEPGVVAHPRPGGGKALVGATAQQLRLGLVELVELELVALVPALDREGPAGVLVVLASARRLDHSVQRDALGYDAPAHDFSFASARWTGRRTRADEIDTVAKILRRRVPRVTSCLRGWHHGLDAGDLDRQAPGRPQREGRPGLRSRRRRDPCAPGRNEDGIRCFAGTDESRLRPCRRALRTYGRPHGRPFRPHRRALRRSAPAADPVRRRAGRGTDRPDCHPALTRRRAGERAAEDRRRTVGSRRGGPPVIRALRAGASAGERRRGERRAALRAQRGPGRRGDGGVPRGRHLPLQRGGQTPDHRRDPPGRGLGPAGDQPDPDRRRRGRRDDAARARRRRAAGAPRGRGGERARGPHRRGARARGRPPRGRDRAPQARHRPRPRPDHPLRAGRGRPPGRHRPRLRLDHRPPPLAARRRRRRPDRPRRPAAGRAAARLEGPAGQPWRGGATRREPGSTSRTRPKLLFATEIVIGPRLGSPLGRMLKLPVMPSVTLVSRTASSTPERSPLWAIAPSRTLAACPAYGAYSSTGPSMSFRSWSTNFAPAPVRFSGTRAGTLANIPFEAAPARSIVDCWANPSGASSFIMPLLGPRTATLSLISWAPFSSVSPASRTPSGIVLATAFIRLL